MFAKEKTLEENLAQYEIVNDILNSLYKRVDGSDFYWKIFPNNERVGELNTDFSKPNAIFLYHDPALDDGEKKRRLRRRIMLDDTWEDDFYDYIDGNDHALCGGLSYRGRSNKFQYAQRIHAMIFDLDGVGEKELRTLFIRFGLYAGMPRALPLPTYIVSSGTGLHLYYVFKEPIDLFPNTKLQLKSFKHDLTEVIWDYKATSQYESIQYQSLNQAFRMVGSINDKYNVPVIAYEVGEKVTMEYLNSYVFPEQRVDLTRPFAPSKVTMAQAKELYPEWYERVVVSKSKNLYSRKKWDIAGKVKGSDPYALYHWWLRKLPLVKGGHRYFYMMATAIYACKNEIPKAQLRKDLYKIYEVLRKIEYENELTKYDVESALEIYSKEYYTFPIRDIAKLTNIEIPPNKRNHRKQKQHVKIMCAIRDIEHPDGEWRNKDGRPSKENIVAEWQAQHPEGKKIDCERDTGLSRHTVLKWWE